MCFHQLDQISVLLVHLFLIKNIVKCSMFNNESRLFNTSLEGRNSVLLKRYLQDQFINEMENELYVETRKLKIPPHFGNTHQMIDSLDDSVDVEDQAIQNHLSDFLPGQNKDQSKPPIYHKHKPTAFQQKYSFTTPCFTKLPNITKNWVEHEVKKDLYEPAFQENNVTQMLVLEQIDFHRNASIIGNVTAKKMHLNLHEIDPFDDNNYTTLLFRSSNITDRGGASSNDFTLTPLAIALIFAEILSCLICCCLLYNIFTCVKQKSSYNKKIKKERKRKKLNGQMKTKKVVKSQNDVCV